MKNFKEWLECRDGNLMELLSQEELVNTLHNADKYAQEKTEEERKVKESKEAIDYLSFIIDNIENWVEHDQRGMEKLKWIAALFDIHEPQTKLSGSLEDTIAKNYAAKFKDMQTVRNTLNAENIVRHLGNHIFLLNLVETLKRDWDSELLPKIIKLQGKEPMTDQSIGNYGKNYAHHVVSTIYHTAQELKKGLEKHLEEMESKKTPEKENKPMPPTESAPKAEQPVQPPPASKFNADAMVGGPKTDFTKAFTFKDKEVS